MIRKFTFYNSIRHMDKVDRYSFRQFLVPTQPIPFKPSRLRTLNDSVVLALGDKSQPQRRRSLLQVVVAAYKKTGIKLRPGNGWLLLWQLIVVCIIIFYLLELGLLLAFREAFWQDDLNYFISGQIIIFIVLVMDVLISPLKCYYEEGLLIKDTSLIIMRYLRGQFWIDLLGLLSVVIPLATGLLSLNLMKLVWLAKIYTASRINVQFQRVTQLNIGLNTSYLVVKLIVFGYIYGHYMGIFFYIVSLWVYQNNYYGPNTPNLCWVYNSWALYQMAIVLNWHQMYAYIMYYSIAVVTTIAYGDITPKNPIECIYTSVALIAVTILWGYIMTEILRVMIAFFTFQFDRRFTHFELVSKLRTENIQQEVQAQVRAHTSEIDREEQFRNRQIEEQIMHFLPSGTLYGLLLLIYQAFLQEIGFRFFYPNYLSWNFINCRSLFLEAFMKDIKEQRHYTGDLLYSEGESHGQTDNGHGAYYFTKALYASTVMVGVGAQPVVREGRVERKGRSFELSKPTTIFGEVEFLNGQQRSHWAFCLSNCVLLVASRNSLLQHYHLLSMEEKEKVLMQMETAAESNCLICHKQHAFLHCPYSFLNPYNIVQSHQQVFRQSKLFKTARTRLKTESSWTIFKTIRSMRMQVTQEYRERLLQNKNNHSLFIEYQLQADNQYHQDEDFESKLHETEVMVERLQMELMREMGRSQESLHYDCVRDYLHYKPHNNIKTIIWKTSQKSRYTRKCLSDNIHNR